MYQNHSQTKNQLQYITLLDKCTQIIREDRIWLRNMVKAGNQQALSLFKGIAKNVDMKQLQIKLRKYIMRVKERERQQQLQRFKENMQLPDYVEMAAEKRHYPNVGNQINGYGHNNTNNTSTGNNNRTSSSNTRGGTALQPQYQNNNNNLRQQSLSSSSRRGVLVQNQPNNIVQERSSFAAKWNNYSHYSHNNIKNGSGNINNKSQQNSNNNNMNSDGCNTNNNQNPSRKQWQSNYKPHSFNKNLNYQLANKLHSKNTHHMNTSSSLVNYNCNINNSLSGSSSPVFRGMGVKGSNIIGSAHNNSSNRLRHNVSTSSLRNQSHHNNMSKRKMNKSNNKNISRNYQQQVGDADSPGVGRFNRSFTHMPNTTTTANFMDQQPHQQQYQQKQQQNQQRSTSSKSLRQLQHKIYEELRQFQQNKSNNINNKSNSINSAGNNNRKPSLDNNNNNSNTNINRLVYNNKPTNLNNNANNSINSTYKQQSSQSKQSIEQMLRMKLGNCDFEQYKKTNNSFRDGQYNEDSRQQQQQEVDDGEQQGYYGYRKGNSNNNNNNSNVDGNVVTKNNNKPITTTMTNNTNNTTATTNLQSTSQRKPIYYTTEGMFPPIQQQTERDSESQRYPEQPLRFGFNNNTNYTNQTNNSNLAQLRTNGHNNINNSQQQRHRQMFRAIANSNNNYDGNNQNSNNNINQQQLNGFQFKFSEQQDKLVMLDSFNPLYQQQHHNDQMLTNIHINNSQQQQHQQISQQHIKPTTTNTVSQKTPTPTNTFYNKHFSQSLYQSAEKKSDFNDNFLESELHRSIMESIKKSRQLYPLVQDHTQIPYRAATSQVASFSTSMHGSVSQTHSNNYSHVRQEESLFTSPQLLNQCRNFLKKTQQINFQNSGLGSNFTSSVKMVNSSRLSYNDGIVNSHSRNRAVFESPVHGSGRINQSSNNNGQRAIIGFSVNMNNNNDNHNSNNNNDNSIMLDFPQPITITESITKDYYQNTINPHRHQQQSISNYTQSKINSLFQSREQTTSNNKNIDFQTYSKAVNINNDQDSAIKSHSKRNSPLIQKRHSEIQQTIISSSAQKLQQQLTTSYANKQSHNNGNLMNQTNTNEDNYRTSQFRQVQQDDGHQQQSQHNQQHQIKQMEKQLYELIELEDIIDKLLEANQGNLEVDSTWLKHTISNHCIFTPSITSTLSHLLHEFIIQPNQTHNFIDLLEILYAYYTTQCPNYRPRKCPASDINALLDIEQKGYIVEEDVQNFIGQLESAGVQKIQEIAHYLQQTFNTADLLGIKKIGYVNLYVIKNEDCFEALWGELQQFQFQVEGEQ